MSVARLSIVTASATFLLLAGCSNAHNSAVSPTSPSTHSAAAAPDATSIPASVAPSTSGAEVVTSVATPSGDPTTGRAPSPPLAPTRSQAPASLPGTYPCDPDSPGFSISHDTGIRPAGILVGCATGADSYGPINWSTWTATLATATTVHTVNNCIPNCADGKFSKYAVLLRLSDPKVRTVAYGFSGSDPESPQGTYRIYAFSMLSAIATTAAGGSETVGPSGDWGFAFP